MRQVYGINISQEAYSVLKILIQSIPRGQKADLGVALSILSLNASDFVRSNQQLKEVVQVLCVMTQETPDAVCKAVISHYEAAAPEKAADVGESLSAIVAEMAAAEQAEKTQSDRVTTAASTRRTRRPDTTTPSQRQTKLKYVTDLSKRPYEQQIADCTQSFTKTLQQQFQYDATLKALQDAELDSALELTEFITSTQKDDNVSNSPVSRLPCPPNDPRTAFVHTTLCQCPPQLFMILAPVSKHVPPIKANNVAGCPYAVQQIDISYQNEQFDDPDIDFHAHKIHSWLSCYDKNHLGGLMAFPIYKITTKKPTPQGHSLLDLPGCYMPKYQVYESLLTRLRLRAYLSSVNRPETSTGTKNGPSNTRLPDDSELYLPLLSVLFELSKLKFFSPLQFYIDQSVYGNEGRYLRFMDEESNEPGGPAGGPAAFLKAVGAGGGVRVQVHCARDVLRGEEVALSLRRYFALRSGSPLYVAMQRYIRVVGEVERLCETCPWTSALECGIFGSPKCPQHFKDTAQVAARDGFLITFLKQELQPLLETISIKDVAETLRNSLRGYGELNESNNGTDSFILIDSKRNLPQSPPKLIKPEPELSPKPRKAKKQLTDSAESNELAVTFSTTPREAKEKGSSSRILGVLGSAPQVPQEHQFYTTIIANLMECGHLANQRSFQHVMDAIPGFETFIYNFLLLRYGDWQTYGLAGAGQDAGQEVTAGVSTEKQGASESKRRGRKARYGTLQGDTQYRESLMLESRVRRIMAQRPMDTRAVTPGLPDGFSMPAEPPSGILLSQYDQLVQSDITEQTVTNAQSGLPVMPNGTLSGQFSAVPGREQNGTGEQMQASPQLFDFQQLQGLEQNLSSSNVQNSQTVPQGDAKSKDGFCDLKMDQIGYSDQDFQQLLTALNQMFTENNEEVNTVGNEMSGQKVVSEVKSEVHSAEIVSKGVQGKCEQKDEISAPVHGKSARELDDLLMFELIKTQTLRSPRFRAGLPAIVQAPADSTASLETPNVPGNISETLQGAAPHHHADQLHHNHVYMKVWPCFYQNYVPFASFMPESYQCFDRLQQEKIYVESHDFIKRSLIDAIPTLIPEDASQIALRYVHQNFLFDLIAHGQRVSQSQYVEHTLMLFKANKPTFCALEPLIYQVFNIETNILNDFYLKKAQIEADLLQKRQNAASELASYLVRVLAGPGPGQQSRDYESVMSAKLPIRLLQVFGIDLQRQMADLAYQFVSNLPPLSHRVHRDGRRVQASEKQPRAPPGFDGFCGTKYCHMPNRFGVEKPKCVDNTVYLKKSLFSNIGMQSSFQILKLMSKSDVFEALKQESLTRLSGKI